MNGRNIIIRRQKPYYMVGLKKPICLHWMLPKDTNYNSTSLITHFQTYQQPAWITCIGKHGNFYPAQIHAHQSLNAVSF